MSNPTEKNIATVMNGFEEFFNRMIQTQSFALQEFVSFMEPKFKAAGYRENINYNVHNVAGGGVGNILILTEGGAGDFVMNSGAIREIRRIYPGARITLTAHPRTFELAECCPYIDEIIFDPQDFPLKNIFQIYETCLKLVDKLLEQRFDLCFAFAIHANTPLLMYMSGAKTRMMLTNHSDWESFKKADGLMEFLTRLSNNIFLCDKNRVIHTTDKFLWLLESVLHMPITNRKLEAWYTPADVAIVKAHLKNVSNPIYALCMGGSSIVKQYPPEKYAILLEMILAKEPTAKFVILGGGKRDLYSAEIIKKVASNLYENNIIDLTNKINYRQSGALLSFCNMYIGNDTGTMHLAAAVDCPVLSPNSFAADLPSLPSDFLRSCYPYGVPSVIVQPKNALKECKNSETYSFYGCAAPFPHCITQIKPETLFKGFNLLKKRVAKKIDEPLYIH